MAMRSAPATSRHTEAEQPFWISFSDLMTALTVLFLIAMAVAIRAVHMGVDHAHNEEVQRGLAIEACMAEVQDAAHGIEGVSVREHAIDFGSRANFQLDRHDLTPQQVSVLREFVPRVLSITRRPACRQWLKRIVVDGFASAEGTYLHNLDLSIERSERVLCVLLNPAAPGTPSEEDRRLIQRLFFVGGSSFNSLKQSPAESRRIELKLEFYDLREPKQTGVSNIPLSTDSVCPIDQR